MSDVQEATEALRLALHQTAVERHVQDAFDNLASCLVLLNSSSPSVQMIRKLCAVLSQPFLPLYNACLKPALRLSYAVLSTVLGKLCDAHNAEDGSLRAAWDATAEVILSGVLDFLEHEGVVNAELHDGVWEALCRIICEFFFLDSNRGPSAFSIPLCLSVSNLFMRKFAYMRQALDLSNHSQAYNTLTEIAVMQITIRSVLCQRAILGGERLGAAISATRDYLLLEALLILFARLLPPIFNTSQGKLRRVKFVNEVLGSPKLFKCAEELLNIMQKTSDIHWDNVSAQIIDALARSDITYPQPFAIDEIHVCGRVFPQPLATDRLIMDRQAFLVNIVVENDDPCESLQVPYSHIRIITLDSSEKNVPKGKVLISVYLTSPPLVADVEVKLSDASHLHAKFMLQDDAVGRFMEALRRRGVGKLSFLNPLARVEGKRKSVSIGSGFKFTNDSSPIPPTASFEGKVQHVNEVYKTDIEDTTALQVVPLPEAGLSPTSRKPPLKNEKLISKVPRPADITPALDNTLNPLTDGAPKSIKKSTEATRLLGGDDELSDISEFEVNNSTSSGLEPANRRMDRMWINAGPSATSGGTKRSPHSAPKLASRTEGVAHGSPATGKSQFISDSPIFGASSSTQIEISPKLLSHAANTPKNPSIDKRGSSCTELVAEPARKVPIRPGFANDGPEHGEQHARHSTSTTGATCEVNSLIVNTKDTSVPPKIAGSRRKREPIGMPSKPIIEVDDEYLHSRKKRRGDGLRIREDKVTSNTTPSDTTPIPGVKRSITAAKCSSPQIDQAAVDFDELAELKSTHHGTRRSSRIKKRQAIATGRVRSSGKTRKGKQNVGQSASAAELRRLAPAPPQDTDLEIGHCTQEILSSHTVQPLVGEFPASKINSQPRYMELSTTKDITPNAEMRKPLESYGITACINQPGKESRENLGSTQEAAPDEMQLIQERLYIKNEDIIDHQQCLSDVRTVNEVSRLREVVDQSITLQGEDLVEPTTKSTPRKELVTIDLTGDDSPTREDIELDARTKLKIPDLSDGIAIGEHDFTSSPRNRRRSVTFASPVEYVQNKKLQSKTQGGPSSTARNSQPPLAPESSTLSPLRISTRAVNARRESHGQISPQVTFPNTKILHVYDRATDVVGIQDIVDVLDEIQAVIIKGISDRFRNVKKDVQHSRNELIQQVLNELRGMVVDNVQYFNELLRLEEGYYKNCKAIIRCWEELIDCNDDITIHFQNALKEHDQNTSAKTFPRSLVPLQPVFNRHRENA